MRPVYELSNQEKAKCLHKFLPGDVKTILSCIENVAAYTLNNKKQVKQDWTNKGISVDHWFFLAEETLRILKEHRQRLISDSQFFADKLFSAYIGIFSLHCIKHLELINNQRLLDGLNFFFDLKLRKHILSVD